LTVLRHSIDEIVSNDIVKIEGRGYVIESGACTKNVKVKDVDVTLLGTREILEKVNKDDILLLPGDG